MLMLNDKISVTYGRKGDLNRQKDTVFRRNKPQNPKILEAWEEKKLY
jgi:hypothetical protein